MKKEIWRDIEGYEGRYQISSYGNVRSLKRNRVMVRIWHTNDYWVVWLRRGPGHHVKYFVHRLVAQAFLPNPGALPVVNHIDHDRENVHVSNLEWVTFSENTQYYYAHKARMKHATIVADEPFDDADIPFGPSYAQHAQKAQA